MVIDPHYIAGKKYSGVKTATVGVLEVGAGVTLIDQVGPAEWYTVADVLDFLAAHRDFIRHS